MGGSDKLRINANKTYKVSFRISYNVYQQLVKESELAGMNISEYLRVVIKNKNVTLVNKIVYDSDKLYNIFAELGKIGSNLNQIARYLNSGNSMNNNGWQQVIRSINSIEEIKDKLYRFTEGDKHGNHKTHKNL